MQGGLVGFPIVHQLNEGRYNLFWDEKNNYPSFSPQDPPASVSNQIQTWLAHKLLTVGCFPANFAAVGISVVGMTLSACTLGALKVAVFAVTLGNWKLPISTGFCYFGECFAHSAFHLGVNTVELMYDAAYLTYQSGRAVKWVFDKLHLTHLFIQIMIQLGKVLRKVAERMAMGFEKAMAAETEAKFKTPFPVEPLNEATKRLRVWNEAGGNRPVSHIFTHGVLSLVNTPANAAVAVGAGMATVALSTAFVAKFAFCTVTGVNVPVPTYVNHAFTMSCTTAGNVCCDLGTNIADSFIMLYKIAELLQITKVAKLALEVAIYIPTAICTNE